MSTSRYGKIKALNATVSGRGSYAPLDREIRKEFPDLGFTHFRWMAPVVKEDEAPDPTNVDLLGSETEVFQSDGRAHLIQQFWWGHVEVYHPDGTW